MGRALSTPVLDFAAMTHAIRIVIALLFLTSSAFAQSGAIVAVGGGGTTDAIVKRTLELAGGTNAVVVVLPQSSAVATAGDSSVKMWLDAGAKEARKVDFKEAGAKAALEAATLIWMPGGDQNRFMTAIAGTGLDDVIRARHKAGTVIGGTSAGAAVLSERMITGDADLKSLTAGKTVLGKGLGVWTEGIFDQHFLQRQRTNRLLSAVLDTPGTIGIGIDEATAAIVRGRVIEVVGRSAVVVFDGRTARAEKAAAGAIVAGTGIVTSVLREGMSLDLATPNFQLPKSK